MICNKCGNTLPEDSVFCQYCGSSIERENINSQEIPDGEIVEPIEATEILESESDDVVPEEALNAFMESYAKDVVKTMDANSRGQPDHESEMDFGLVPEKPIYTLALKSVEGEHEYLNGLYTIHGEKIRWTRSGSTIADGVHGMIDIYDTFLPSGQPYKTIYINMYGARESTKAPHGFLINDADVPAPKKAHKAKKVKQPKKKYCSRCGSLIDNKSKQCTGCGKKYFKGIRFNKFTVTIIVFLLVIAASAALNVYQYMDNQGLHDEVDKLESRIKSAQASIDRLISEKEELRNNNLESSMERFFFSLHAEIVGDDGSNLYHKYGCEKLDRSNGFWILNTEAAEGEGYVECQYCH